MALATLAAMLAMTIPAVALSDALASYRWKSRVLLIVAPDKAHPLVAAQRAALSRQGAGISERDLVVLEATGRSANAQAVRSRFGLDLQDARAILIGKDGGEKLVSAEPIEAAALFAEIDSMPMRRDEMRQRR